MSFTSRASVVSRILTESLGPRPLDPLYRRSVMPSLLNAYNLDGKATGLRRIPVRQASPLVLPRAEGEAAAIAPLTHGTPIEATPVAHGLRIPLSIEAITQIFPGITREQAEARLRSPDPSTLDLVGNAVENSIDSHARTLERDCCALFAGASRTAGTSAQPVTMARVLDALAFYSAGLTAYNNGLEGTAQNHNLVLALSPIGVNDLKRDMLASAGALLGNPGMDVSAFSSLPQNVQDAFRGTFNGMRIVEIEAGAMPTANAGVDQLGALFAVGSGETAAAGARGFAEVTWGFMPTIAYYYDERSKLAEVISESSWAAVLHTDAHIVGLVYDID